MKKIAITFAFAAALLVGTAGDAYAQSDAETVKATVVIPTLLFLNVNSNSVDFGSAGEAELDAGLMTTTDNTILSYKGNVSMTLNMSADAAFFSSSSGSNDAAKPASDLNYSTGGSYADMPTTDTPLVSGAAPGKYDNDITVTYTLDVAWSDPADSYDLDFTFTLTTP